MKYIRTKYAIFEVVDENEKVYRVKARWTPTHIYSKSKCQTEVIAEADTIEELCDEFVYLMESGQHICKSKHTDIMYCFNEDKPLAYYGAIWTDKGLIYVAKMNKKGELELL